MARGGRCLIADQMGVGKTIQALALGACYLDDGPLLVVVPASMRVTWAREAERWLPALTPRNLHVINGGGDKFAIGWFAATEAKAAASAAAVRAVAEAGASADADADAADDDDIDDDARLALLRTQFTTQANEARAKAAAAPRVVITSYEMASKLSSEIASVAWGAVVVDESHALRTTQGGVEKEATKTNAVLEMVKSIRHAVLVTGTPSLTRPFDLFGQVDALCHWNRARGMLGKDKYQFADAYCAPRSVPAGFAGGGMRKDVSGGVRLGELHAMLSRNVMIRRLKRDVAKDLPN